MYGCTMENVAYFLQYSGLPQPQATHDNSRLVWNFWVFFFEILRLASSVFEKLGWFKLLFWWNCDSNYVKNEL